MSVRLRVVGTTPPGLTCRPSNDRPDGYRNIHVGVQRKQEVVDRTPGDRDATFEFDVDVRNGRFAGPFVHGRGDERFIYLSWGEVDGDDFRMFRRAKVQLDVFKPSEVDGHTLEARISLTDAKGHPTCASLRPPRVTWSIVDP